MIRGKLPRKKCKDYTAVILNIFLISVGFGLFMGLGSVASGVDIVKRLSGDGGAQIFTCKHSTTYY